MTFNPSALLPSVYTVTARSGVVEDYKDTCIVRIVKVIKLTHKIGHTAEWKDFGRPQKILLGKASQIHATVIPDSIACKELVLWDGSYGVRGRGETQLHTYAGSPATSNEDFKSVLTNCGPIPSENFLVCSLVVGIHSNAGLGDGFTDGHAWISVTDFESSPLTTVTFGLWGNKAQTVPGSDVHVGLEPPVGKYNRYFLLMPSQFQSLKQFLATKCEWSVFYTCANWAEDGYRIASGETISSDDCVVFGTPRAIGKNIEKKESHSPTLVDVPYEGGEDAPSSSSGSEESSSESSFPQD